MMMARSRTLNRRAVLRMTAQGALLAAPFNPPSPTRIDDVIATEHLEDTASLSRLLT